MFRTWGSYSWFTRPPSWGSGTAIPTCNLGQGQPEVGDIDGALPRLSDIHFEPADHAYGPVGGTDALRQAVADHYNRLFRRGKASQYGKENVAVADGGRLVLSRVFAALSSVKLAYKVPDYTAYEDMIGLHLPRLSPVMLRAGVDDRFSIPAAHLEAEVVRQGIQAFVFSNPCNPTGQVVSGDELAGYVRVAREHDCTLICDEFYSHFYIYTDDGKPGAQPGIGCGLHRGCEPRAGDPGGWPDQKLPLPRAGGSAGRSVPPT